MWREEHKKMWREEHKKMCRERERRERECVRRERECAGSDVGSAERTDVSKECARTSVRRTSGGEKQGIGGVGGYGNLAEEISRL